MKMLWTKNGFFIKILTVAVIASITITVFTGCRSNETQDPTADDSTSNNATDDPITSESQDPTQTDAPTDGPTEAPTEDRSVTFTQPPEEDDVTPEDVIVTEPPATEAETEAPTEAPAPTEGETETQQGTETPTEEPTEEPKSTEGSNGPIHLPEIEL